MIFSPRFKAGVIMTLLLGFCLGIGFVFGVLAHQAWKKKTDRPEFMKWAAMKQLEKLELSPEQRPKLESKVNAAIDELVDERQRALRAVWDTIDRACVSFEEDLSTEQKLRWSKLRPKRPAEAHAP